MGHTVDLTGKRFGRLVVVSRTDKRNSAGGVMWECACDCGKHSYVSSAALNAGAIKSCGCINRFGEDEDARLLGYRFSKMKSRCYNKNDTAYEDYGGRGIYICDEWLKDRMLFIKWAKEHGFKPELEIDRYPDNDGPYAPWNCRFATTKEQNNNKRSNRHLIVNGIKLTAAQWADKLSTQREKTKLHNMLGSAKRSDTVICKWLYSRLYGDGSYNPQKKKRIFTSLTEYKPNSSHVSLIDKKFNHLVVVKEYKQPDRTGRIRSFCDCLCDCGNTITVIRDSLLSGNTKYCGCMRSGKVKDMFEMKRDLRNESKSKGRIKYLEKMIAECNAGYWERSENIVDDPVYDSWVEELRQLDPENPLLSNIGSGNASGKKVEHKEPVLSLDKVYSWGDLVKWCESVARDKNELFCFSPKYDGVSLTLDDGMLLTRGKGKLGTDISHLAPWIKVRLKYDYNVIEGMMSALLNNWHKGPGHFGRMTGELLVPIDHFEKLRNTYPEFAGYKTPRNLASGFSSLKSDSGLLKSLTRGGIRIPVCTWVHHRAKELTYPLHAILTDPHLGDTLVKKLRNFKKLPTDGIVCRLEDDEYAKSLGCTAHHPRGSMALKFVAEEYVVEVKDVVWQVGNEAVTPVAVFDPIEIDGVEVERATAHNINFVLENGIGIGAEIKIIRQGGVIPKIIDVVRPGTVTSPGTCPACGHILEHVGTDLICKNKECTGRIVNKITDGLQTLGMKGVGPKLVEKLVKALHIPDIMTWCQEVYDQQLLKAKGLTAFEIHVLMSEFERVTTKGIDDAVLLSSLCIPQVGEALGNLVIKYSGSIMTLAEDAQQTRDKLYAIPRINSTALTNAIKFVEENRDEFMVYYNLFKHNKPLTEDRPKFCFTGALPNTRKEVEQWVLDHGGYPTDNIRQANYLVTANPLSSSSKMLYAKAHDIPVINFQEMQNLLGSSGR